MYNWKKIHFAKINPREREKIRESLNKPIYMEEIENIFKELAHKTVPGTADHMGNCIKHFVQVVLMRCKLFECIKTEGRFSKCITLKPEQI